MLQIDLKHTRFIIHIHITKSIYIKSLMVISKLILDVIHDVYLQLNLNNTNKSRLIKISRIQSYPIHSNSCKLLMGQPVLVHDPVRPGLVLRARPAQMEHQRLLETNNEPSSISTPPNLLVSPRNLPESTRSDSIGPR